MEPRRLAEAGINEGWAVHDAPRVRLDGGATTFAPLSYLVGNFSLSSAPIVHCNTDNSVMTTRRWVLVGTSVTVAALAAVFAVLGWDATDKVASGVSALTGVAALGVAVWVAWPTPSRSKSMHIADTGQAKVSGGGRANTGFSGARGGPDRLRVERTGDADASDGGDANTGAQLD